MGQDRSSSSFPEQSAANERSTPFSGGAGLTQQPVEGAGPWKATEDPNSAPIVGIETRTSGGSCQHTAGQAASVQNMPTPDMKRRGLPKPLKSTTVAVFFLTLAQITTLLPFPDIYQRLSAACMLFAGGAASYLLVLGFCCKVFPRNTITPILLDRFFHPIRNWQQELLRTFLELFLGFLVLVSTYTYFQSFPLALSSSTIIVLGLSASFEAKKVPVSQMETLLTASLISSLQVSGSKRSFTFIKLAILTICLTVVPYALFSVAAELQSTTMSTLIPAKFEGVSVAYLLMLMVAASFICAGELLVHWGPTHSIGLIVRERLVNSGRNWEYHTVRSVIEVVGSLVATWVTYASFEDALLSIQLGTLAGIILVVLGNWWCTRGLVRSEEERIRLETEVTGQEQDTTLRGLVETRPVRENEHQFKVLPLLCLVGYVGIKAINVIFLNFHDIALAIVLTTLACVPLIFLTEFLLLWPPTRLIGQVLQDRWLLARRNWQQFPVRSFIEVGCWLGVIYGTYALYKDLVTAIKVGTLSVVIVVMTGEYLLRCSNLAGRQGEMSANTSKLVPLLCLLVGYVGAVAFNVIYTSLSRFDVAFILATLVSIGCIGLGELVVSCKPTFWAGFVLQDRLINVKDNWKHFPLRSLIEVGIWTSVAYGSYVIYYDPFAAIQLATLSGMIVALSTEYFLPKSAATLVNAGVFSPAFTSEEETASDPNIPPFSILALVAYAICGAMYLIYENFRGLELAFVLATLAGVMFALVSQLLIMWRPTRTVGAILQSRVVHFVSNWQDAPIRSFVELGSWLCVIYGSYAIFHDLMMAIQLGTFSAMVVVLGGEALKRRFGLSPIVPSMSERAKEETEPQSRMFPLICLFGYVGLGAFNFIFDNFRAIEIALLLSTMTGIAFIVVGDIFVSWGPTKTAGTILQKRVLNMGLNWRLFPLRSFVETGFMGGVTYGSYAIYSDLAVAVQLGVLSTILIILTGESLGKNVQVLKLRLQERRGKTDGEADKNGKDQANSYESEDEAEDESTSESKILPLPLISLFGFVGVVAFNTIYSNFKNIRVAFFLATVTGVLFVVAGDLFVIWGPTRQAGLALQSRVIHAKVNWNQRPIRSLLEIGGTVLVSWSTWCYYHDIIAAVQWGTIAGISVVLIGESVRKRLRSIERRLENGQFSDSSDSPLLSLPYDTLFEVATYLTPEELLEVRLCNKRINQLLTAEASRYWRHVSEKIRGVMRTSAVVEVRSTLCEVIKTLSAYSRRLWNDKRFSLFPVQLSRHSQQSLQWVHVNAAWIREQNMVPMTGAVVCLEPGQAGYEIFRHIPDKATLGITIKTEGGIRRICIPGPLYTKLQKDPVSFVASATVGMSRPLSMFGVLTLLVFTMTLIVTGHCLYDFAMGLLDKFY